MNSPDPAVDAVPPGDTTNRRRRGLLLLALGFIFLVYDGIRSISDGGILLTKASDIIRSRTFDPFFPLIMVALAPAIALAAARLAAADPDAVEAEFDARRDA